MRGKGVQARALTPFHGRQVLLRAVLSGTVLNLKATTSQKCEEVPRRARM